MTGYTNLRLTPLAALLAALPLTAAYADTPPAAAAVPLAAAAADTLPTVSITATRLAKDADTVAPNTAVLSPEGSNAGRVRDIQTLFADEPGVNVNRDPARRGNAGVNIRGIEGNRVLMQIDGVTLPSLYAGGGAAISGRDMVELDTLSAVEVVKGPYSGLYGADAIAGVVEYRTLDVQDLLQAGASSGGRLRAGYYGADNSKKLGAAWGLRSGDLSGLLSYTARRGENLETHGSNDSASSARTTANPLAWDSSAVLAKLGWMVAPGQEIGLTQDVFNRSQDGNFLSSRTSTVLSQTATDKSRRNRTSLNYDYTGSGTGLVGAKVSLYRQHGESREYTLESRAGGVLRTNDSGFEQDAWGASAQLTHRFDQGDLLHTLVWGAEYSKTETSRPRMRQQFNANGTVSNVVGGEVFPQKTFPDNDSERTGVFVQDEIALGSGITLTPSLRYDRYTLTPKPDALFNAANPFKYPVNKYSDSSVSPRLALSLPLAEGWTGFMQAGTGFRAPNFDDAMLVFTNAAQGYEVLPNPNLKSETSSSLEIGTRYRSASFEFAATAYRNRYHDFIDNVLVSPVDTNGNGVAMEFQAQNVARVRIQGLELKALWRPLKDLRLRGSLAYAKGDKLSDNTPLDSVDPLNGSLAAEYDLDAWHGALQVRGASKKERVSSSTMFRTPGYGVVDLSISRTIGRDADLLVGVYNLADRKYWLWTDVKGQLASATVLDRYTQAGRTAAINLDYHF
ncbi:TonB-dependent hemoglobin/transferrin/lactoferrin family receptor [Chitinimonas sp.]|uniref:TonB-dependent hemoglobin/transferrin/lactoferrin family receptor n=1 Tax=Chitinimonas sp. TaxID=1934313 RepID=UPI002F947FE1